MRNRKALIAGILAGITSPATLASPGGYPTLQGSDMSRMRQDVRRVGSDFSTVINRENVKKVRDKTTGS